MPNPMFKIADKVTATAIESYTDYKNFRLNDYNEIDWSLLESINIPNKLKFIRAERIDKLPSFNQLNSYSNYEQWKFTWSLYNEEEDKWIEDYFISNVPVLYEGLYLFINGSKYYLTLSIAHRGTIHSKEKIIFKNNNDMFVLDMSGIGGFNFNGKKVNFILVLLYKLLLENKSLNYLLESVFSFVKITDKKDPLLKTQTHTLFKDFAIIYPKYPNIVERAFIKGLEKLKRLSAADFKDEEEVAKKIKSVYGSPTSKKGNALLMDLLSVFDSYTFEQIIDEIKKNIRNEYTTTQLERYPTYSSIFVDALYSELKLTRKIFVSSSQQNYQKLQRMFNKTLLKDIIVYRLYKNKLLQFFDGCNLFDTSLKTSLLHSTGRAVSSDSREVNDDYYKYLSLFTTSTGKAAGTVSYLAPV